MTEGTYCRNCGVRLNRVLGRWRHAARLGAVPCRGAEPDTGPEPEAAAQEPGAPQPGAPAPGTPAPGAPAPRYGPGVPKPGV
jgi:hypothetical protein